MKLTSLQLLSLFKMVEKFSANNLVELNEGGYRLEVTVGYNVTHSGKNIPLVETLEFNSEGEVDGNEYTWFKCNLQEQSTWR